MRYIITPNHDYLFIDTHHIVNDGMSNTILLKELNHLYQDKPLPKVEHQYKDYSEWLKHRDLTIQQRYWHSVFNDEIPVLNLPTDYPRPNTKQTNGNMIRYTFNRQLTTEVKKYLQQHNVTDFMFFMSAVMVLLSKYSRQQDIVVGSVISARTHKDTESMLGMFANTLVYRGFPNKDKAWETFLKEMKQVSLEAYEHQDYPFERLVDELIEERDASRNPLFDVMLVLQNNESSYAHFGHSELTHIMPLSTTAKFDLSFIIEEDNGQYVLNLEYCTNLFNQETIEIMGQQLEYLIQTIVTADDLTLAQLSLCSEETKKWIINEINDEETPMLQHHNIVALFEEQVLEKPDSPAICFEDIELSYAQLGQWVDSIIYELKASGVETGQTIALYMQRGIPMIASMLAIGKMGCTYVPIDPTNPQMRTAYILQDAQVSLILLHNTTIDTDLMCIDVSTIQLRDLKFDCIDIVNQQALYIIYTSGTTGNPKGVTINHKNVGNLVLSWYKALDLSGDEVFMQYANYVFDASVWEIYTALSHGHKLVIANDHERLDVRQLEMLIKQKEINVASLPVQVCNMMSNYHIKRLVTGGSVSTPAFVEKVSRYSDLYFNAYGPTEATVISTYWSWTCNNKHSKVNRVPIGKPITNVQVYIMEGDQLCGINEPGELCIAGAQLSNGYINQVEMTESCFEDNPFGHGQLYHSGDLARYLPDGNIEFLGRLDDQVKVRGYRIELSEIENVIISHPDVVDCAVIVEDEKRKSNIVAYYVGDVNKEVDIINKIRKTLPQYMVPNHIRHLEEIPLTKNGKLNRDQLPRELGNHHRYVAPRTYNEQILQQIFCDVLQRNQLSIDDDFFELGGSSLDVMAVVAHLKKYNILINMQDIYQNKTIRHILNEDQNMSGITVKVPDNLSQLNKIIACNQLPIKEPLSKESLGNVCLTGATGFLGAYILESLQTKADKIVCVVRSENSLTATEKLQSNLLCYFDSKKVIQIMNRVDLCVGDFTEDLKLETYQIDTIIHAGARTDHFGETHMFNQSNVESTKHLIKVAQQLNIKFIYISTISIGSIFPESHEDNRFSETDLYKGQVIDSPYTLSKFYGELAVLNAIEGGLNAKIIRVGNLTSSTTGKINMKNMKTNRFSIIMKNLLMLDEVGETVAKSYVEFSFVDIVAQAVVNIAMLSNEYAIFHVFNPYQITIQELLNTFKEENKPITIVDDGTFHNILNEQQMYEVIGLNSSTQAQQPAQIDAAFTNEILRNMGVYWQKLNKGWLCEWHKRIKTIFKEGI
ncbi:amino acid adenylation domain-containing protein [Staphylococcus sp. GSSP0090]|nr:amino acid adenylation domain-containing protein [Staphylococcus sp. GSSP0090]